MVNVFLKWNRLALKKRYENRLKHCQQICENSFFNSQHLTGQKQPRNILITVLFKDKY